jgi:hypothetical protein
MGQNGFTSLPKAGMLKIFSPENGSGGYLTFTHREGSRLTPAASHVGFVADKLSLGQFSSPTSMSPTIHTRLYLNIVLTRKSNWRSLREFSRSNVLMEHQCSIRQKIILLC